RFTHQLNDILSHMEVLGTLDLEGVEAIDAATEWIAPLRADDVAPDALRVPPSELAPSWRDGFFTVPRLAALDVSELDAAFEDKAAAPSEGRAEPEELAGGGK